MSGKILIHSDGFLSSIPYGVRTKIIDFLKVNDAWKRLAGILNFTSLEVDIFDCNVGPQKSAAESFWIEYCTRNPTINELFCALSEIKHYSAMRELLPYVPRILHSKIPGLEVNSGDISSNHFTTVSTSRMNSSKQIDFLESNLPGPETRKSHNLNGIQHGLSSIYNQGLFSHQSSVSSSCSSQQNPLGISSQISEISDCDNTNVGLVPTAPEFPIFDVKKACALRDTPAIPYTDIYAATEGFNSKYEIARGKYSRICNYVCPRSKIKMTVKLLFPPDDPEENKRQHKHFVQVIENQLKYKHKNIVQLYGYSMDVTLCLVYEYLANGSLHNWIHFKGQTTPLTWQRRMSIMLDMANGLVYLHSNHVIHFDLKSTNVLLDENFNAKLTDIGKAVVALDEKGKTITTGMKFSQSYKESCGYFTRDYLIKPTFKSDIFSLGVVIGELCFGIEALDEKRVKSERCLYDIIADQDVEKLINSVDPKAGNWPEDICCDVIQLCRKCVYVKRSKRPDITVVCSKLEDSMKIIRKRESYTIDDESDRLTMNGQMIDQPKSMNHDENQKNSNVPYCAEQIAQPSSTDYNGKKCLYPSLPSDPDRVHSISSAHSLTNHWSYEPELNNLGVPPNVNTGNVAEKQIFEKPGELQPCEQDSLPELRRRRQKPMFDELKVFVSEKNNFESLNHELSHQETGVFQEDKAESLLDNNSSQKCPISSACENSQKNVMKDIENVDPGEKVCTGISVSAQSVGGNQVIVINEDGSSDSETDTFWSTFSAEKKSKNEGASKPIQVKLPSSSKNVSCTTVASSISSLDPGYLETDIDVEDIIRSCGQNELKSKLSESQDASTDKKKKSLAEQYKTPSFEEEQLLSDVFDNMPNISLGQHDEFLALGSLDLPHYKPLPGMDDIPSVDSQDMENIMEDIKSLAVSDNMDADDPLSLLRSNGVSGPPVDY